MRRKEKERDVFFDYAISLFRLLPRSKALTREMFQQKYVSTAGCMRNIKKRKQEQPSHLDWGCVGAR
jgi:hypothetical protein